MPLAYAHIVQVLVDLILWMFPFMAFSTGSKSKILFLSFPFQIIFIIHPIIYHLRILNKFPASPLLVVLGTVIVIVLRRSSPKVIQESSPAVVHSNPHIPFLFVSFFNSSKQHDQYTIIRRNWFAHYELSGSFRFGQTISRPCMYSVVTVLS